MAFSREVEWVRNILSSEQGYEFDTPEKIRRVVLASNCGVCRIGAGSGRHVVVDDLGWGKEPVRTPVKLL